MFSLTPRKARATGLVVRRVILRLTSKPTSMGWLREPVYGHGQVFRNEPDVFRSPPHRQIV